MQDSDSKFSSQDYDALTQKSTFKSVSSRQNASSAKRRLDSLLSWLGSGVGSVCFHVVVLLVLFLILRYGGHSGTQIGERQTDEVGIVFSNTSNKTEAEQDLTESNDETPTQAQKESESQDSKLQDVVEQLLPSNEIGLTAQSANYSSILNSGANPNSGASASGSGQTVGFGDAKGSGSKFMYVLDRSDSMSWKSGAPMRKAVGDAIASIESLDPKLGANKFQIVAYNHDVEIFREDSNLVDVTPANKTLATRFLRSLIATGGTDPEKALEKALKFRPDVVFFLTDADEELTSYALAQIQSLRKQYKVKQICVVEFGKASAPKKKSFRQLAGENNGTYVFKNIESM